MEGKQYERGGIALHENLRKISGLDSSGRSPRGLRSYHSGQPPKEGTMDEFKDRLRRLRERLGLCR